MTATSRSAEPRAHTVLHVIHGLGSGVEQVVHDYVRATPEVAHHAVYSVDPTCHAPGWASSGGLVSAVEAPSSPLAFCRAVRRAHRAVAPTVVHAHSSVAGAVTRTVLPSATIVYTPHCFAFVRRDTNASQRAAFWLAEALLARRTRALAACSPHEAQMARRFMPTSRVHYVPNVASSDVLVPPRVDHTDFRIVASGRLSAQKDPDAFADLAAQVHRDHPGAASFVWIGSGPATETERLERAGVRVTGWVPREEVLAQMAGGDLYVHTARWEATPLTILEAARVGVPVLARATDPIRALGTLETWTSAADLRARVGHLLRTGDTRSLREASARLTDGHRPAQQAQALRACYERATRSRRHSAETTRPTPRGART